MHNLTMEELINENARLKCLIEAADKQDIEAWLFHDAYGGLCATRIGPQIDPNDAADNYTPVYTRPPITSERELELLSVIEQKHAALLDLKNQVNKFCEEQGAWDFYTGDSEKALALTPDLSALKEN